MIGTILRNQVPMLITFKQEDVEFVCEILGESLVHAYSIIDMFEYKEEEESEW